MTITISYCTVGAWKENAYLIAGQNEAWLVDPGDDFEILDSYFKAAGKRLKGIINTHGHFDHIGAVHDFKKKYAIPFYIHSKDAQLVRQGNLYKKLAGGNGVFTTPSIDAFIDKTASFQIDDKEIKVHELPGHTNGSVAFEIENQLISGDLFFKDNLGRVDLPGGNERLLRDSITYVLENFKGYKIYPGHGDPFLLDDAVINRIKSLM